MPVQIARGLFALLLAAFDRVISHGGRKLKAGCKRERLVRSSSDTSKKVLAASSLS